MNAGSKSGSGGAPALRGGASPRLRDRLKEATRSAIVDAAEAVFSRDGVQSARMEDVAGAAGVAVGTLYNYFEDRTALLQALLETRRTELLARIDAALADRSPPFERRLQAFLAATFEYFQEHLGLFALHMEAELVLRSRASRERPLLQAVFDRTARLTKDGVTSGALRGDDAELYPAVLMGMLRGLFMRHIYGIGGPPTPDAAQRLARLFLRGVGKEAPPRSAGAGKEPPPRSAGAPPKERR
jgi:AcrR family transcriptional regulator